MILFGEMFEVTEAAHSGRRGVGEDRTGYEEGDHLASSRVGYVHHGLYVGGGLVVHYSGFANGFSSGAIAVATLDEFANGNDIRVVPHPSRVHSPLQSVNRAFERLGEDWYNVLVNNCEHFVHWCIEGRHSSPQVSRVVSLVIGAPTISHLLADMVVRDILFDKLARGGFDGALESIKGSLASAADRITAGPASAAKAVIETVTPDISFKDSTSTTLSVIGLAVSPVTMLAGAGLRRLIKLW